MLNVGEAGIPEVVKVPATVVSATIENVQFPEPMQRLPDAVDHEKLLTLPGAGTSVTDVPSGYVAVHGAPIALVQLIFPSAEAMDPVPLPLTETVNVVMTT
jgi:hypothetical protein